MVDGCFDPLHRGHLSYFAAARRLGVPVLCNLAPDSYVTGKHLPFLPEDQRVELIDALRDIDFTHLNRGRSTADVLRQLRPRYYVKGGDWRGRLPKTETTLCGELGIEIAYVDHTGDASRNILKEYHQRFTSQLDYLKAFEAAVSGSAPERPVEPVSGPEAEALAIRLEALLQPQSVEWIGDDAPPAFRPFTRQGVAAGAWADLVVGWWPAAPPALAELKATLARVTVTAQRWVCLAAPFQTNADHILAVAGNTPTAMLARVLVTLDGFRSRPDLEALVPCPPPCTVLILERV